MFFGKEFFNGRNKILDHPDVEGIFLIRKKIYLFPGHSESSLYDFFCQFFGGNRFQSKTIQYTAIAFVEFLKSLLPVFPYQNTQGGI
jgi:hypothetical protein